MYTLDKIKKEIVKKINETLQKEIVLESHLVYPPNLEMGDISLPCFGMAKGLKSSPAVVAQELIGKIGKIDGIETVKAIGPYLNFNLDRKFISEGVLTDVDGKKDKYGINKSGKKKRVMIEWSNVNTHKEYHLGHLRNLCYGDSINRLLSANGYTSIPVSFVNDFGIHVAKTLWAYLEYYKDAELPENKGYFLGQVYVRASKELKENAVAKQLVELMMKKIETRKGEEYELWKKTREWSIEQFDKIYKELGVKFDTILYESEYIKKGSKMIQELIDKKFLIKSQGAIIADLEKYNLGVLMFLRTNGTALYPVADVPMAIDKFKKFKLDKSIYVVDNRQSLYLKQLFKVVELLGFNKEMVHLAYDVVKLPSGMMSSRDGNVITYEDLSGQLIGKLKQETKERHEDWSSEKVEKVARVITNGAIKFEMIKVGADQIITFDIDKALEFNGYTSAYLQYTYARLNSVIKKSGIKIDDTKPDFSLLSEEKENQIVLKLSKYPGVVLLAGEKYSPAEIAKYVFELSQIINDYYHSVQILKSEKEIMEARLYLIKSVNQVIKNCLTLLGIEVLEEM